MSTTKRSDARARGLALAARVATVSGMAIAAFGLAEARLASASEPKITRLTSASDDTKPLPMEGWLKTQGGCGCAPCWGPPAPPRKRSARVRRRHAGTRGGR